MNLFKKTAGFLLLPLLALHPLQASSQSLDGNHSGLAPASGLPSMTQVALMLKIRENLSRYYKELIALSPLLTEKDWNHFSPAGVYQSTNENKTDVEKFLRNMLAYQGRKLTPEDKKHFVGVSSGGIELSVLGQIENLDLFMMDVNPYVPYAYLPLLQMMISLSRDRLEFLSYLYGFTPETEIPSKELTMEDFLELFRVKKADRRANPKRLNIGALLPPDLEDATRNMVFHMKAHLDGPNKGAFLRLLKQMNFPLSYLHNEQNFQTARAAILNGRITAMRVNLFRPLSEKITLRIAENHSRVIGVYLSNISDFVKTGTDEKVQFLSNASHFFSVSPEKIYAPGFFGDSTGPRKHYWHRGYQAVEISP